jgi:hypothetical protein
MALIRFHAWFVYQPEHDFARHIAIAVNGVEINRGVFAHDGVIEAEVDLKPGDVITAYVVYDYPHCRYDGELFINDQKVAEKAEVHPEDPLRYVFAEAPTPPTPGPTPTFPAWLIVIPLAGLALWLMLRK